MDFNIRLGLAALLAVTVVGGNVNAQNAGVYEGGVVLSAADLLPAELLKGESHRVRNRVIADGYMAHFEIDTDFGQVSATGVPEVKQRIAETEAIRKLVEASKGDLFAEGMRRSIEQPIDAVKNIVTHPVQSVKKAPKTVGHFFGKVGSAIGRGVSKTVEKVEGAVKGGEERDPGEISAEVGRGIGTAAKKVAGFDRAKLATAKQLNVDPYSDNARLQEEMDKVTWAFFAGGIPLRIGVAAASAGTAVAAVKMVGVPDEVYELTEGEIAAKDERMLLAMGVPQDWITEFGASTVLTPTSRHRIVKSLGALGGTAGRKEAVFLAGACETPEQVNFLTGSLSLLAEAARERKVDFVNLGISGRLLFAVADNGDRYVGAPVDYVTWTEEVADFAGRDDLQGGGKVLVHTGKLSPEARTGFAASGWKVIGVPYGL